MHTTLTLLHSHNSRIHEHAGACKENTPGADLVTATLGIWQHKKSRRFDQPDSAGILQPTVVAACASCTFSSGTICDCCIKKSGATDAQLAYAATTSRLESTQNRVGHKLKFFYLFPDTDRDLLEVWPDAFSFTAPTQAQAWMPTLRSCT